MLYSVGKFMDEPAINGSEPQATYLQAVLALCIVFKRACPLPALICVEIGRPVLMHRNSLSIRLEAAGKFLTNAFHCQLICIGNGSAFFASQAVAVSRWFEIATASIEEDPD